MCDIDCDDLIYRKGQVVCILNVKREEAEKITILASNRCGFKIDWHYAAGRVVVKTLGNVEEALKEVTALLDEEDE